LEPGHLLKVSRHGITKKKYWNPSNEIIHNRTEADWIDKLEELLIDAFKYRMVSDVPVGVFLSGGIDSSLLTAILQKHHRGINTFTIGFEESEFDESNYAKKIAELLQTNHYQKNLTLSDAKQVLDQYYSIYDEPFADTSGIPTACVAAFAKKNGMKVVLSADGGDELFGGYTHYPKAIALFNKFASLPKIVRAGIAKGSRILLPPAIRSKVYPFNTEHRAYALEELATAHNPIKFFESFIANQTLDEISRMIHSSKFQYLENSTIGSDPLQTMMAWDFQYYLPDDLLVKVDRATMFHSIECREPFLDHRLVEFARRIPNELRIKHGKGKYLLQQLLNRYLPLSYFERKKQGFSIPVFAWFKRELDELFAIYLTKEKINPIPFLDFEEIQKEYDKYKYFKKRGKQYNIEKMWRVLSFLMWWDKYMIDED
jgi:asparagine synthase (glutamine-hydrolysing)